MLGREHLCQPVFGARDTKVVLREAPKARQQAKHHLWGKRTLKRSTSTAFPASGTWKEAHLDFTAAGKGLKLNEHTIIVDRVFVTFRDMLIDGAIFHYMRFPGLDPPFTKSSEASPERTQQRTLPPWPRPARCRAGKLKAFVSCWIHTLAEPFRLANG